MGTLRPRLAVLAAVLGVALAGCTYAGGPTTSARHVGHRSASSHPAATNHAGAQHRAKGTARRKRGHYRLVQYPGAGFSGFYAQTRAAKKSIDMEMYELADVSEEHDLAAAAHRGVRVRVLLDKDFSGGSVNAAAYAYLRDHGVSVRWAPAGYIFHIKTTTFDRRISDVSTANLTSRYYATTRDAEVIDTDRGQVRAIEATFESDFDAAPGGEPSVQTHQARGLVWSPNTGAGSAESAMVAQISRARHSVELTSEELSDPAIYDALAADARRGVRCRIVMTLSSEWNTGFAAVKRAGCSVHVFPDTTTGLYIHEKIVLVDHGRPHQSLLIGSQNGSDYSLTRDRELSLLLSNSAARRVIDSVATTFARDYRDSSAWSTTPSRSSGGGTGGSGSGGGSSCHPLSAAGNCCRAGEFCSDADHGLTGVDAYGETITCEQDGSSWRWLH